MRPQSMTFSSSPSCSTSTNSSSSTSSHASFLTFDLDNSVETNHKIASRAADMAARSLHARLRASEERADSLRVRLDRAQRALRACEGRLRDAERARQLSDMTISSMRRKMIANGQDVRRGRKKHVDEDVTSVISESCTCTPFEEEEVKVLSIKQRKHDNKTLDNETKFNQECKHQNGQNNTSIVESEDMIKGIDNKSGLKKECIDTDQNKVKEDGKLENFHSDTNHCQTINSKNTNEVKGCALEAPTETVQHDRHLNDDVNLVDTDSNSNYTKVSSSFCTKPTDSNLPCLYSTKRTLTDMTNIQSNNIYNNNDPKRNLTDMHNTQSNPEQSEREIPFHNNHPRQTIWKRGMRWFRTTTSKHDVTTVHRHDGIGLTNAMRKSIQMDKPFNGMTVVLFK